MKILVVDDHSTDRTPEIVRKFVPNVRLIQKTNGGQASAFNAAIPEARGEIVAFLDGDDWWANENPPRTHRSMILTVQVKPEKRCVIPSVKHVHESARPQTASAM